MSWSLLDVGVGWTWPSEGLRSGRKVNLPLGPASRQAPGWRLVPEGPGVGWLLEARGGWVISASLRRAVLRRQASSSLFLPRF